MLASKSVRISDDLYHFSKTLEKKTCLNLRFELRGSSIFISGTLPSLRKLARRLRATGMVIGVTASEKGIFCNNQILKAIGL
jgi:hypothetical protein